MLFRRARYYDGLCVLCALAAVAENQPRAQVFLMSPSVLSAFACYYDGIEVCVVCAGGSLGLDY